MKDIQLGSVEARFADIIWNNEPISSTALVKMSEEELGWKKSTTYTVLRRLCDKGLFQNDGGTVCSVVSKDEFCAIQSERVVNDVFGGSLPAFLAAFTGRVKLPSETIEELRRMVDEFKEE